MTWVAIGVGVGSAVVGAGAQVYGSQQAANAQTSAAKRNAALAQQQFNTMLAVNEPSRALGYGAMSDLASLYGYNLPGYTNLNTLMSGGTTGPGAYAPITVHSNGKIGGGNSPFNPLNALPGQSLNMLGVFGIKDPISKKIDSLFGGGQQTYGGTINPLTGMVDVKGKGTNADELLTDYLRTGEWGGNGKGKKYSPLMNAIEQLRASGWQYDPNAVANANQSPAASGTQAGNMSRFFASPDYQFRLDEGLRTLQNSAAARGGLMSGNALRAISNFGQNTAAGEYDNYFNRLMRMAGYTTTANNQVGNASSNYTNTATNANTAAGDARASGVAGTWDSVGGLSGDLGNALMRYLGSRGDGLDYMTVGAKRLPGG